MTAATINVKYVNQPGPGKKNGTIKTPEGVMYLVPPHMLKQFTPGGRYDIQYSEHPFNGKNYMTVTHIVPVGNAPAPSGGGGSYGRTDDATAERIFVCGALNAAIQAGQVTVNDVAPAVRNLRAAWAVTFGGKVTPTQAASTQTPPRGDMDDEIPF